MHLVNLQAKILVLLVWDPAWIWYFHETLLSPCVWTGLKTIPWSIWSDGDHR